MSIYKYSLPKIFPYIVTAKPDDIRTFVNLLLSSDRTDVPQGSSFAVTVDNWNGTWNLCLSKASRDYLHGLPELGEHRIYQPALRNIE